MIQANELRIGNWIEIAAFPNSPNERWEAKQVDILLLKLHADPSADIKSRPIELSPEVLKPYGFYREDGDKYDNSFIQLQYREDYGDFIFYYKGRATSVSTLHHLQNLYYALHGVELKPYLQYLHAKKTT